MLTHDTQTQSLVSPQCLAVHRGTLSLLHGIKFNLSSNIFAGIALWLQVGQGGDTPQTIWLEKGRRGDRGAQGRGIDSAVMSQAGWVNNQTPSCSRWCLLEYKQSWLLTTQPGRLLRRHKRLRWGRGRVKETRWTEQIIDCDTKSRKREKPKKRVKLGAGAHLDLCFLAFFFRCGNLICWLFESNY